MVASIEVQRIRDAAPQELRLPHSAADKTSHVHCSRNQEIAARREWVSLNTLYPARVEPGEPVSAVSPDADWTFSVSGCHGAPRSLLSQKLGGFHTECPPRGNPGGEQADQGHCQNGTGQNKRVTGSGFIDDRGQQSAGEDAK